MKKLLIVLAGWITAQLPLEAHASSAGKDSVPSGVRHLSETDFMVNYAKDDSSKALIRYYFIKRHNVEKRFFRPAIGFTALAALGFTVDAVAWHRDGSMGSALNEIMAGLGLALAFVFSSLGVWRLTVYSRKKLLRRLLRYQQDGFVPDVIARNRLFRQLCKGYPDAQRRKPRLFPRKGAPAARPAKP